MVRRRQIIVELALGLFVNVTLDVLQVTPHLTSQFLDDFRVIGSSKRRRGPIKVPTLLTKGPDTCPSQMVGERL